jgi:hypothetical protein
VKHGPNWSRKDISVADGQGHTLWIKMWGKKVDLASDLTVGTEVSVKNVITNVYNGFMSVGSTDLTEIEVFTSHFFCYTAFSRHNNKCCTCCGCSHSTELKITIVKHCYTGLVICSV